MTIKKYSRKEIARANAVDTQKLKLKIGEMMGYIPSKLQVIEPLKTRSMDRLQEFIHRIHMKIIQSSKKSKIETTETSKRVIYEENTSISHEINFLSSSSVHTQNSQSHSIPTNSDIKSTKFTSPYDKLLNILLQDTKLISSQDTTTIKSTSSKQKLSSCQFPPQYASEIPYSFEKQEVPWLSSDITKPVLLSQDLELFASYVTMDENELNMRGNILQKIDKEVKRYLGKKYQIQCFGSLAVGLGIYCSDIDISIIKEEAEVATATATASSSNNSSNHFHTSDENAKPPPLSNYMPTTSNIANRNKYINLPQNNSDDDENDDTENDEVEWILDDRKTNPMEFISNVNTETTSSLNEETKEYLNSTIQSNMIESNHSIKYKRKLSDLDSDSSQSYSDTSDNDEDDDDDDDDEIQSDFDFNVLTDEMSSDSHKTHPSSNKSIDLPSESISVLSWLNEEKREQRIENLLISQYITSHSNRNINGNVNSYKQSSLSKLSRYDVDKVLSKLYHKSIKKQPWIQKSEYRHRAKVPIINFIHKTFIEVDISLGMTSEDTTDVVRQLITLPSFHTPRTLEIKSVDERKDNLTGVVIKEQGEGEREEYRKVFIELSSFLKVLLATYQLDVPFLGGIGSYKLYMMVANIIKLHSSPHKNQSTLTSNDLYASFYITYIIIILDLLNTDNNSQIDIYYVLMITGDEYLIKFFKHYQNIVNLNNRTIITFKLPHPPYRATVDFGNVKKADRCRQLFRKCHDILSSVHSLDDRNSNNKHRIETMYQSSYSFLSLLLNCKALHESRSIYKRNSELGLQLFPVIRSDNTQNIQDDVKNGVATHKTLVPHELSPIPMMESMEYTEDSVVAMFLKRIEEYVLGVHHIPESYEIYINRPLLYHHIRLVALSSLSDEFLFNHTCNTIHKMDIFGTDKNNNNKNHHGNDLIQNTNQKQNNSDVDVDDRMMRKKKKGGEEESVERMYGYQNGVIGHEIIKYQDNHHHHHRHDHHQSRKRRRISRNSGINDERDHSHSSHRKNHKRIYSSLHTPQSKPYETSKHKKSNKKQRRGEM